MKMKVPWGFYSLNDPLLEHYQHLEDDPDAAVGLSGKGEEEAEEEPEFPYQQPYPPFWEPDPDRY